MIGDTVRYRLFDLPSRCGGELIDAIFFALEDSEMWFERVSLEHGTFKWDSVDRTDDWRHRR